MTGEVVQRQAHMECAWSPHALECSGCLQMRKFRESAAGGGNEGQDGESENAAGGGDEGQDGDSKSAAGGGDKGQDGDSESAAGGGDEDHAGWKQRECSRWW